MEVSREAVKVIDLLSDKDEIYVDVTAGRKTKALGLLFGVYARVNRIKRIMYVKEEDKSIVSLPRLSYSITPGQHKIITHLLNHEVKSMSKFAQKIEVSQAMLYKHIRELKDMDVIEEAKGGLKVTDYGRIVVWYCKMENGQKTVLTLFNGDKHFIIPKHQRAYGRW